MPADDSGPADPSLNVANEENSSVGSTSSSPRSTAQGVLPQIAVQLPDHVARKVELSRIQFFKTVKKLLIQRLPDDVRRTMTEDDLPSLTPDSLDGAATWREIKNISNEAADRLAEIAARFVAEKDRLQWIDEQLEEWEAQIVGDGRQGTHPDVVGAQRSIVELACLVLRERRGIGTDSSRKILEDNLGEAIEGAKSQAMLKLHDIAPHDIASLKSGEQLLSDAHADQEPLRLGELAGKYDENLRRMAKAGRRSERELRQRFPELQIWRALDESTSLSRATRDQFFEISLLAQKQFERFRFIGEILGVSASTLYDYYKKYRKKYGLQKTRSPKRTAQQDHS